MSYHENYCLECDWSASKKHHSTGELASLAIDHAVSTGHDIESRPDSDRSDIGGERFGSAIGFVGHHEH